MAINFKEVPSCILLPEPHEVLPLRTVAEELAYHQSRIKEGTQECEPLRPLYDPPKPKPLRYTYRLFCTTPRFKPRYCCRHAGNIILDRDVLSKDEHLCFLAQPRKNHGQCRGFMQCYYKKRVLPNPTARILKMAEPTTSHLQYSYNKYFHVLEKKRLELLEQKIEQKNILQTVSVADAIELLQEERRLLAIKKRLQKRRCQRYKMKIQKRQRKQIRHIICVLFEEMRDFLLNDQFIMDSPLSVVILQSIRNFTDAEFITTNNLKNYQKIMANNLAIWINKFITNLDIHVEMEEKPPNVKECDDPMTFLPIEDYISLCPEEVECEECNTDDYPGTYEREYKDDYESELELTEAA